MGFDGGSGFDVTEMGTEKRLALWVVRDPEEVEGLATLGVDPLDASFYVNTLAKLLAEAPGNIKTVLAAQSLIAGIGNAYSDEILHMARLSPFKPARNVVGQELVRLHSAIVGVLGEAVGRAVGQEAAELKGDKKRAMRVHGRTGQACPECGDVIREVSFATKSLQYCATCQTGGKPLADRRLSKLLR
jgi:formamidopyrimidine-DNA glycosylase